MFRNTYQSGFLSILYSIGSKPLQIWDKKGMTFPILLVYSIFNEQLSLLCILVRNGHIKRITDPDIQSSVLEIMGTNVSTTFIQCPADPKKTLGIKLPFLVMIIKNVSLFSFYYDQYLGLIFVSPTVTKILHLRSHGFR